jgi:putative SOS response-associated peptidase YedK
MHLNIFAMSMTPKAIQDLLDELDAARASRNTAFSHPGPRSITLPGGYGLIDKHTLDALPWGLVPHWAKDPKIAYKTINAGAKTVGTGPSYRQAFKKRRCLISVDGFYESKRVGGGASSVTRKVDYNRDYIEPKD